MRVPLIYKDQPIFGFDLGTRTAKMLQLKHAGKHLQVMGYGYANFPDEAIVEGIVVDPEVIAETLKPLIKQISYGKITATRVATALPVAKLFTRILELPPMNPADLDAAVRLEAEQYVPVPLPDLYIDYEVVERLPEHVEVLMVAAPRAIVDSYIKLFDLLGLEVAAIESSLSAVTRALTATMPADQVTLLADIGSGSIDLAIYDKVVRLTDTIAIGGDTLTTQLVSDLGITREQANEVKFKFGLGPSGLQPKIQASLKKPLQTMSAEMRRVLKYYTDRSANKRSVQQIALAGGSASLPGLVDYLSKELGLPVVIADPWNGLEMKNLPSVSKLEAPIYTTAIGLARREADHD